MSDRKRADKKIVTSSKMDGPGWGNTMDLRSDPILERKRSTSPPEDASPAGPGGSAPLTPSLMAAHVGEPDTAEAGASAKGVQVKYWAWTSYDDEDSVKTFSESKVDDGTIQYICWQPELCPSTQRMHLQAVICLTKKTTMFGVRKLLLGEKLKAGHLSMVRDLEKAIAYSNKDDSKAGEFCEFGTRPSMRQLAVKDTGQSLAVAELRKGASIADIMQIWPAVYLRHCRGFQDLANHFRKAPSRDEKPFVLVLWGPTGTGKSHTAQLKVDAYCERHTCNYARIGLNGGWWDGYSGEQALIIEEFLPKKCDLDLLLQVCDKYDRVRVPVKGGFAPMNARFIVLTSSQDPSTWYKDNGQLARRVSAVCHLKVRYERKQSWHSKVVTPADLDELEL